MTKTWIRNENLERETEFFLKAATPPQKKQRYRDKLRGKQK